MKHSGVLKRIVSKGSQTTVLKKLIVTQISDSNSHSIQSRNYEQDLVCEAREYEHIFSFGDVKNLQTQLILVAQIDPIAEIIICQV